MKPAFKLILLINASFHPRLLHIVLIPYTFLSTFKCSNEINSSFPLTWKSFLLMRQKMRYNSTGYTGIKRKKNEKNLDFSERTKTQTLGAFNTKCTYLANAGQCASLSAENHPLSILHVANRFCSFPSISWMNSVFAWHAQMLP